MEGLSDFLSRANTVGSNDFTKNNSLFSREVTFSSVDPHENFDAKLNGIVNPCAVNRFPYGPGNSQAQQSTQPANTEEIPTSIWDWVLDFLGGSPERQADEIAISGAAGVIARHEGTGIDFAPFNNDAQIGQLELAKTSGITGDASRGLRSLGDANGFLNQQEIEQAQQHGLVTIHEDGLLSLTKKGEIEYSRADMPAESPVTTWSYETEGGNRAPVSTPVSTSKLHPENVNEPGFTGTGLHGRDFYPDMDGDGDSDVVIYVDENADIDALEVSTEKLELASGARIDFQIVTGATEQLADKNNGIWLEVKPGGELPGQALGVAGGNNIVIRYGYENELQVLMHELMHTLDMNHDDGDQVLGGYVGSGVITELSSLEVANLVETAGDYSPGINNQPNSAVDYLQWQGSLTTV